MATNGHEDSTRGGTRVFKKTSPNGKITTYLGKRDFIDRGSHVDLIDGMVLVDEEYLKEGKKITAHLLAAFRYGREDLDVLGLTFRKDLISQEVQVYPQDPSISQRPLTRLQERLRRKLGTNAFPFWFEIPARSASSVTLQPAPGDTGKPCGVDYELKTIVGNVEVDKSKKGSSGANCVRLAIRKLTYAPFEPRPQPMVDVSKEFIMSNGLLHMEVSLDKEMYYHGESICVNVHVQNNTNKTVKRIKAAIIQVADICLFTTASYTCEVARLESNEGCPVGPGGTLSKVYTVCPLLSNNRDKRGLALDGQLKHEDTNLASSTIMEGDIAKENLGIVVQYKVKVRALLSGPLGGEIAAELPFTLTHAKPIESPDNPKERLSFAAESTPNAAAVGAEPASGINPEVDIDLINLEDDPPAPAAIAAVLSSTNPFINSLPNTARTEDDDLIFEDFARYRLRGTDSLDESGQPSTPVNGQPVGISRPGCASPSDVKPILIPSPAGTPRSVPGTPGTQGPPPAIPARPPATVPKKSQDASGKENGAKDATSTGAIRPPSLKL